MTAVTRPMVGAKAVAELLDVSDKHIRNMAASGQIPHYRAGKHYRFDLDEVLQALRCPRQSGSAEEQTPNGSSEEGEHMACPVPVQGSGHREVEEIPAYDWSADDET